MEQEKLTEQIVRSQNGDLRAQEELVAAVQDTVYYHCKKMLRNEQDALDASQDILYTMLTKLQTLREPAAFWGWLHRIIANRCRNQLNRGPKELSIPEDEEGNSLLDTYEELDAQVVPDRALDNEETRRMIVGLIDSLPDSQRICVLLYYYDEMSVKQIAETLEIPENTVKSRLNYGRRSIKQGVERYEKEGVKLYGLSPLPFLLYFLRQDASSSGLSLSVKQALAHSALSAASQLPAAVGTAVENAVPAVAAGAQAATVGVVKTARLISLKLAAGLLAGTLAVGAVSTVGGSLWTKLQMEEQMDQRVAAVEQQAEAEKPQDLEGAFTVLDTFLQKNRDEADTQWIDGLIAKAENLCTEGEYLWATRIVKTGLKSFPENQALLDELEKINSSRNVPLLETYDRHGVFVFQQAVTSRAGELFDSGNAYTISCGDPQDTVNIPINSKYRTLSGKICLQEYHNGCESLRFVILGDGKPLFERAYTPVESYSFKGTLAEEDFAVEDVSLDVSGIDLITVKFFATKDNAIRTGESAVGRYTISTIGMADFLLHQN